MGKKVFLFMIMVFAGVLPALLMLEVDTDNTIIAFYPKKEISLAATVRSGGLPLRFGTSQHIMLLRSQNPDIAWNLYKNGAWLVIDGGMIGGCFVPTEITQEQLKNRKFGGLTGQF